MQRSEGGVQRKVIPLPINTSILSSGLASLQRDAILYGFHEAAHFIACARASIEEEVAQMARQEDGGAEIHHLR